MFLPIGDEPNPRGHAYVNYLLIAVNVAVFVLVAVPLMGKAADPSSPLFAEYVAHLHELVPKANWRELAASVSQYDLVVFKWGYKPSEPSLLTVLTSMFMHGGWMHLIGNMLFLYIFGDNVEQRLGRLGYLVTYLACGAAATFFFALFAHGSPTPLVGASGAISGVLGLYFVWFPRNVVKMLMVFGFVNVVRIPARYMLGFYLIVDNLLPFLAGPVGGGGVAHGAHIGGFIAGFLLAYGLQKAGEGGSQRLERFAPADRRLAANQAVFTPTRDGRAGGMRAFREALAADHWFDVQRIYTAMSPSERDQIDRGDAVRFADYLTDRGEYDTALALLTRLITLHAAEPQWLARAHLRAGLIELHFKNDPEAATRHFYRVLELNAPAEMQQVARNALAQAGKARVDFN